MRQIVALKRRRTFATRQQGGRTVDRYPLSRNLQKHPREGVASTHCPSSGRLGAAISRPIWRRQTARVWECGQAVWKGIRMTSNCVSHGRIPAMPGFNLPSSAGPATDAASGRGLSADNGDHDVGLKQGPQAGNCIPAPIGPASPLPLESRRPCQGGVPNATGASAPVATAVRHMMYWCKHSCRVVIQKGDGDVRA
jgi:hypothetical protein